MVVAKKPGRVTAKKAPAKLTAIDGGKAKTTDLDAELDGGAQPVKRVTLFNKPWRLSDGPNVLALLARNDETKPNASSAELLADTLEVMASYIAEGERAKFMAAAKATPSLSWEKINKITLRLAEIVADLPTIRS